MLRISDLLLVIYSFWFPLYLGLLGGAWGACLGRPVSKVGRGQRTQGRVSHALTGWILCTGESLPQGLQPPITAAMAAFWDPTQHRKTYHFHSCHKRLTDAVNVLSTGDYTGDCLRGRYFLSIYSELYYLVHASLELLLLPSELKLPPIHSAFLIPTNVCCVICMPWILLHTFSFIIMFMIYLLSFLLKISMSCFRYASTKTFILNQFGTPCLLTGNLNLLMLIIIFMVYPLVLVRCRNFILPYLQSNIQADTVLWILEEDIKSSRSETRTVARILHVHWLPLPLGLKGQCCIPQACTPSVTAFLCRNAELR